MSAQVVFNDNFETTPTGVTVGNPPPNPPYAVLFTNANDSVTVATGVSVSGSNSLHVVSTDNGIPYFRRTFGTNLTDGRLGFDFLFNPTELNDGHGPSLWLNAPRLNNFGVESPLAILEFFASSGPGVTNITFRLQSGSGFQYFTPPTFPAGSFQHIEIGWAGANFGLMGHYYVAWDGITNTFTPANSGLIFTNITSFQSFESSQTGGNYNFYVDNLSLVVPEPSVLALGFAAGSALLVLRRNRKRPAVA